ITLIFWFLALKAIAYPIGVLTVFVLFFFRDPERSSPPGDRNILSPADGKILEVKRIDDSDNPLGGPAVKVSIFMSIFNVHVNRVPLNGVVEKIEYHPGKFFSANLDKASLENERNIVTLSAGDSKRIVVTQIAGLIARRIVCNISEGDSVTAGNRFGLIRFGSRLELLLPPESSVSVEKGDRTRAGVTVIARL
ncbi:MAG: phosphatidylserine decarboxylase family protein, partial [Desulfatiglandaceae bacterium]